MCCEQLAVIQLIPGMGLEEYRPLLTVSLRQIPENPLPDLQGAQRIRQDQDPVPSRGLTLPV